MFLIKSNPAYNIKKIILNTDNHICFFNLNIINGHIAIFHYIILRSIGSADLSEPRPKVISTEDGRTDRHRE